MEIHHLRVFREVAREASFTRAARNLHCAQSTVTEQIKSLEASLGVELFHRRGRRSTQLTDMGHLLLPLAEEILDAVEAAGREIRNALVGRTKAACRTARPAPPGAARLVPLPPGDGARV
ncbi:LysR family transcriptional regulator [Streptomyces sp. NPDC045431]|uniref:LysR family transcriptional regulator n=1 Tax=Streptomyces sp. NPDC045431 TaxID=3155613 RepID=UPI0033CE3B5B